VPLFHTWSSAQLSPQRTRSRLDPHRRRRRLRRPALGIGEEEELSALSPARYIGEIVSVSDLYRFAAVLEDRGYPNLLISKKVFEGHGHTDVLGAFVASGLRYLFSDS
jgi:hypothetical protein